MKPKIVYGAGVNLSGVWGPCKMYYNEEHEEYYDSSGNILLCLNGIGEYKENNRRTTFASTNEREVEIWVSGVKSAMRILRNWCYK